MASVYPYIAARIFYVFTALRANYISRQMREVEPLIQRLGAAESDLFRMSEFSSSTIERFDPSSHAPSELRGFLSRDAAIIPTADPSHGMILADFATQLADVFDGCLSAGNYTDEAVRVLDQGENFETPFMQTWLRRLM